jgi:hypothetical protein
VGEPRSRMTSHRFESIGRSFGRPRTLGASRRANFNPSIGTRDGARLRCSADVRVGGIESISTMSDHNERCLPSRVRERRRGLTIWHRESGEAGTDSGLPSEPPPLNLTLDSNPIPLTTSYNSRAGVCIRRASRTCSTISNTQVGKD